MAASFCGFCKDQARSHDPHSNEDSMCSYVKAWLAVKEVAPC